MRCKLYELEHGSIVGGLNRPAKVALPKGAKIEGIGYLGAKVLGLLVSAPDHNREIENREVVVIKLHHGMRGSDESRLDGSQEDWVCLKTLFIERDEEWLAIYEKLKTDIDGSP